uniref:Uncharacterized protein n=1 Tax=Panagrolaimus sp. JU765 TaxID=591449 RepID=A0AC34QXW6_9BILA
MGDENERLKFEVEHLRRGKERLQKLVEESTGETGQMKKRSTFPMFKKVEGLRGKELTRATLFARSNRVDETSHEVDKSDGNLTETELYSCHSSDEFDGLDIENEEAESKIDWFVV